MQLNDDFLDQWEHIIAGVSNVKSVATGSNHSIALMGDGSIAAWGDNNKGQFGNKAKRNSKVPMLEKDYSGVASIAGGYNISVLTDAEGSSTNVGENIGINKMNTTASAQPKLLQ